MSEKIELKEKLAAIDLGVKSLWDEMDEEQRKILKNEFFLLNRYASSVKTNNRDIKEDYVLAVNEYFNKNWNDLQKHPKLMWQLLSMCGHSSKQVFFHEWIGFKKKDSQTTKMTKFLNEIYPDLKNDEIILMSKLIDKKTAKQLAKDHGYNEDSIDKMF
jgi:hypothetical protein